MAYPTSTTSQPEGQPSAQLDTTAEIKREITAKAQREASSETTTETTSETTAATKRETPAEAVVQTVPSVASSSPPSESSMEVDEPLSSAEVATVPTSVVSAEKPIPLLQELYRTPVRMEYGPGPDEYYPIHLEILCCYSTIIAQASKLAEPLKHKYAEVSKLRKDLEEIVMEDIVSETCSAERANHAMQIVHTCLKEFPLEERQLAIQKSLTHFSEFLFSDPKKLNTGSMAMMKKPEFRNWDLCHRVKLLNSGGAMLLSRRLLKALRNVDDLEKKNAAKSNITAVAQGRIILHGEDSRVVRSVAAWIYDKQMQYIDARHLLKLFSLAEHMGLLDLAQNCLRLLSSSASACLERASTHGVSLYELLRSSTNGLTAAQDADDALRHVVSDIYVFVLSSHRPPKALENIVVETLVAETDSKVFDMFGAKIERRLMRLLIQALYKRQASIKTDYAPSETGYHTEQFVGVADENSLFIPSA